MLPKYNFTQSDISARLSSVSRYEATIQAVGKQYGIEACILKAIIAVESSGNPNAGESRTTGAKGLMQVIQSSWEGTIKLFPNLMYRNQPLTAYINREQNRNWADPDLNILIGTLVLVLKARSLTKMTGVQITVDDMADAPMLLTSYNSGELIPAQAFKLAVAAGSRNPQVEFLNKEHLYAAIQQVVTSRNLGWNIDAKYAEISTYAAKVLTFLELFRAGVIQNTTPVVNNTPVVKPTPVVNNPPATTTHIPQYYVVSAGDTGFGIAKKLGVAFSALSGANPSVNWGKLTVGQKLVVPAKPDFRQPTPHLNGV